MCTISLLTLHKRRSFSLFKLLAYSIIGHSASCLRTQACDHLVVLEKALQNHLEPQGEPASQYTGGSNKDTTWMRDAAMCGGRDEKELLSLSHTQFTHIQREEEERHTHTTKQPKIYSMFLLHGNNKTCLHVHTCTHTYNMATETLTSNSKILNEVSSYIFIYVYIIYI